MTEDSTCHNLNLIEIKAALQRTIPECQRRGLLHTTKWLSELNYSLKHVIVEEVNKNIPIESWDSEEFDTYLLAKSAFDIKEYDRSAHFSRGCTSPCGKFLHIYSKYMSIEKKRLEQSGEGCTKLLALIAADLGREKTLGNLDGYCLYLYGMILKNLDLVDTARTVLMEAIAKQPMNWAAWLQLASLITDTSKLMSLTLPNHWMKQFFLGHVYVELQLGDEALEIYSELKQTGFENSTHVLCQAAIALHNKRDVNGSIASFQELRKMDPYRLDNLDTFSNLLFIRDMRVELAYLAQIAINVDKYRVETCCIIGNYYGLRLDHQKAVIYFQRALKINPQYLSAWTLMGHEYVEMKNTNAAIESYRRAIEVNRKDYRAWYGLGQTYEILKMPNYSCYYYKEAQALRPNDPRMLLALGDTYEKLDRVNDALKCFYKARSVGDYESSALLKLAKLFERLGQIDEAANAYTDFVAENDNPMAENVAVLCHAYKYLANTHLKNNKLQQAFYFAQKCLTYEETKEEGKALLRTIAQKRGQDDDKNMQVEDLDFPSPKQYFRNFNINST